MVDALRKVHRVLRPDGLLVDIRPTTAPALVEVYFGSSVHFAGFVLEADGGAEYRDAENAAAEAVARGLFSVEAEREFSFVRHADTLAELEDNLASTWKDAYFDQATTARLEQWMSGSDLDKEVRLRERAKAVCLRRLPVLAER